MPQPRTLVSIATVFFALLGAGPAAADSPLSWRLQELSDPDLQQASAGQQGDAVSLLSHGPGSLLRVGGALVVEARVEGDLDRRTAQVRSAGAGVIDRSGRYDTLTLAVDESELKRLARAPGVEYVSEQITPMTGRLGGRATDSDTGAINTCAPGIVSEGDAQLQAAPARTTFDVDGTGVKVGVLSDSYDTDTTDGVDAADDVASGDLPGPGNPCGRTTPVEVLDDSAGSHGDEARAMAQIVHDLAPGSPLAVATAFTGQTAFGDNIRALANAGAKVIVDDIIYFTEPMYQDGVIAKAVNDVTSQGVAYFSMAFNSHGNGVNSFEAPDGYRSTACPAAVLAARPGGADSCMDFDPTAGADNTFDVNVGSGTFRASLSWAEAQFGVGNDFDIYVLNGGSLSLEDETDNLGSQTATAFGSFDIGSPGSRQLVIRRYAGSGSPRLKFVLNSNGGAPPVTSTQAVTSPDVQGPTIYGHTGAQSAQTVGAVPFNDSSTIEQFSSRGPVTYLFGPVSGTTPAAPLASPLTLSKPDIAATDGGANTFFGTNDGGTFRFFGTSAAAPHAAAVGALQLEANPTLTQAQLKAAQRNTADPVGALGPNVVGAGLVDTAAALAAAPPPAPSIRVQSLGPTTDPTPSIPFTVSGDPRTVTCAFDGGAAQPCSSPFNVATPVGDGPHTLTVGATDYFGQSGGGSGVASVDTTGPATTIAKGPQKKSKTKKASFEFSSESGARFECKLDSGLFTACTSPFSAKVKKGKHTFEVRATDALGNVGASQAYGWKVKKKRK